MSLIEINRPLLRLTSASEDSGECPDVELLIVAEPGQGYTFTSGTFIEVNLLDESGNPIQVVNYNLIANGIINVTIDSDTPIFINGNPQTDIVNWVPININLLDSNGNPYTSGVSITQAGNDFAITINTLVDLNFNGSLEGQVSSLSDVNVILEDSGGNPVTPDALTLVGNTLTIEVTPGVTPSGVVLQFPNADAHTSYRVGDVGWRLQNGWFDYTPPTNPAKVAQLDLTQGINYWYKLKNPLTVNGVASTVRFVDVNGVQTWGAANNVNQVVIDKLTGLMWVRFPRTAGGANKLWNDAIDTALAHSVVVNGVTYDDWYLPSITELIGLFPTDIARSGINDGLNPLIVIIDQGSPATQNLWSATTTSQSNTSRAMRMETSTSRIAISFSTKEVDLFATYMVRKAINLIS